MNTQEKQRRAAGRKKILFVVTKSNWGGAQRYVFDLATTLPREPFDVAVALGGTGEKKSDAGELERRLHERNVRTIFIPSFTRDVFIGSDIRALFALTRLFRRERPDIVHLNSSKAGGLGAFAARIAGVPRIIFTSHGLAFDEDRPAAARAAIWFFTWLTFIFTHVVICISADNAARARRMPFCSRKIRLIYNGISDIHFESRGTARARIAALACVPADSAGVWIGGGTELTRNKGISYLIGAAAELAQAGERFLIFIIGRGDERRILEKTIADAGLEKHVYLLGFVPDAARLLPAFDVFALTSVKEGLPYILLETGLAQVAVVGSRIPGITDIVKDGESGLLAAPKDSRDIGQKLKHYSESPALRQKMAAGLHNRVTTTFTAEKMAGETAALYQRS